MGLVSASKGQLVLLTGLEKQRRWSRVNNNPVFSPSTRGHFVLLLAAEDVWGSRDLSQFFDLCHHVSQEPVVA